MQINFRLAAAALVSIASLIGPVLAGDASDVLVLTKDSFDDAIKKQSVIMVEFYAPWCGHCKALAPEYEKAASELKTEGVALAKVDCTVETDLCKDHDVQGYPTLKVFRSGGSPADYNKARKADEIVSYMRKQLLPAVSDVDAAHLKEFKSKDKVVVVGFFDEKAGPEFEQFTAAANKLRDTVVFGACVSKDAAAKEKVTIPGIVLYKQFDEGKNVFPQNVQDGDAINLENIERFITVNSVPLMNDIGPENFMTYVESGLPLAYLFTSTKEHRSSLGSVFEPLAKKYRGKISFVYIDANQFGAHARNLNLKEEWPAFGIQLPEKQLKFPFDQTKELNKENVESFVDQYLAGKIKPSIKSQPIPATNDEPVKVIVADTFTDIVLDTSKDVLLEFYAPWCGHCKRLAPVYEEVAEKLAGVKSIVIAKMDATENDVPPGQDFVIEGFPTIKLFKAKTNEVVDYVGERTTKAFVDFLSENASIDFAAPNVAPASDDASGAEHDEL